MSQFSFDMMYQLYAEEMDHWDALAKALEWAGCPWG